MGRSLPTTVIIPAGEAQAARPLLVFLHRYGGDQDSELDDPFFAALAGLGSRAPIVAFPDGDDSFWHDRAGSLL